MNAKEADSDELESALTLDIEQQGGFHFHKCPQCRHKWSCFDACVPGKPSLLKVYERICKRCSNGRGQQ